MPFAPRLPRWVSIRRTTVVVRVVVTLVVRTVARSSPSGSDTRTSSSCSTDWLSSTRSEVVVQRWIPRCLDRTPPPSRHRSRAAGGPPFPPGIAASCLSGAAVATPPVDSTMAMAMMTTSDRRARTFPPLGDGQRRPIPERGILHRS